jgi:hypothetical protein
MADGFRYVGAWDDGEINGTGIATYANGDVYEGMFVNGRRQGDGRDALRLGRGAGDGMGGGSSHRRQRARTGGGARYGRGRTRRTPRRRATAEHFLLSDIGVANI